MFLRNPQARPLLRSANCLATLDVGDCVNITGERVGNRLVVGAFDPLDAAFRAAVGIVVAKQTATTCTVQLMGVMRGVYLTLVPGTSYNVGPDSRLLATLPSPGPGTVYWYMPMGVALASDELLLSPLRPTLRKG